jgi:hypothetical protein
VAAREVPVAPWSKITFVRSKIAAGRQSIRMFLVSPKCAALEQGFFNNS